MKVGVISLLLSTGQKVALSILEIHNQVLTFIFNIPVDSEASHYCIFIGFKVCLDFTVSTNNLEVKYMI